MAPEQIRGQPLDARTDVFAVGVLLYELAAGVHPFGAGMSSGGADAAGMIAAGDVLARIVAEDPPPLETRAMLPPAAVAVVARALAKNPEARFADGRELAEALRALPAPALTPLPTGRPAAGATPIPGSHDLRVQEWWWMAHQLGVAAFFTLVLVPAWMLWRDVEPKQLRVALRVILLFSVAAGVERPPAPVVRGPLPRGRAGARAAGGAALAAGDEPRVRRARSPSRPSCCSTRTPSRPRCSSAWRWSMRGLGHGGAGDEPGVHGAAR